jgi:hypothetical protein
MDKSAYVNNGFVIYEYNSIILVLCTVGIIVMSLRWIHFLYTNWSCMYIMINSMSIFEWNRGEHIVISIFPIRVLNLFND